MRWHPYDSISSIFTQIDNTYSYACSDLTILCVDSNKDDSSCKVNMISLKTMKQILLVIL